MEIFFSNWKVLDATVTVLKFDYNRFGIMRWDDVLSFSGLKASTAYLNVNINEDLSKDERVIAKSWPEQVYQK